MQTYTKLFNTIITSTIWSEDDRTRIVWVTMLALADRNGEVSATIPGLARVAGVPVEAAEAAIAKFLGPDKHSRTKDDDGRRVEEIEGGWLLLNYAKYRRMASIDEEREATAIRQKRWRDRQKRNAPVTDSNGMSQGSNGGVTVQAHNEERDRDRNLEEEKKTPPPSPPADKPPKVSLRKSRLSREQCVALAKQHKLPDRDGHWFFDSMESGGWMRGKNAIRDAEAHFRSYVTGCWLPSLQGTDGPGAKPVPKYFSQTGPKERALKEREKQLREELPDEATAEAMRKELDKLKGRFPTSRTEP